MKANKIYKGIITECEKLENEGSYKGNGHHLAQRLTSMILVQLLPKKQLHIYSQLGEEYVTAKELADKAGIHTKEVSPNIKQMNAQGTLVIIKKFGYITKYKKS